VKRLLAVLVASAALQPAGAATFSVRSEPPGVLPETMSFAPQGARVGTPVAVDMRTDLGLAFSHWSIDPPSQASACSSGRCIDVIGQALHQVEFAITADTQAVAHYLAAGLDTDSDGIADAVEYRYFGSVARDGDDDSDGDGVRLREEVGRGTNPLLIDVALPGAASQSPPSLLRLITRDGVVRFLEESIPLGIIDRERILPIGSFTTTADPPERVGRLRFAWWVFNGVTQRDVIAQPLVRVPVQIHTDSVATAVYLDGDVDGDGDGLPDWLELRWFGELSYGPDDDPDADGVPIGEEARHGLHPLLFDRRRLGGNTASASLAINLSRMPGWLFSVASTPAGIIERRETNVQAGTPVSTPNAPQSFGSLHFACWRSSGEAVRDVTGACIPGVLDLLMPSADVIMDAAYFGFAIDTDGDGLPDWFELAASAGGNIAEDDDVDGDGVKAIDEFRRGRSVTLADDHRSGGIATSPIGPKFSFVVFVDSFELPR
jgi:hypothetical protein